MDEAAEHEMQHADPTDLVDARRRLGGSVSVGCGEILQTSPEPSVVSRAGGRWLVAGRGAGDTGGVAWDVWSLAHTGHSGACASEPANCVGSLERLRGGLAGRDMVASWSAVRGPGPVEHNTQSHQAHQQQCIEKRVWNHSVVPLTPVVKEIIPPAFQAAELSAG
jgi:hypothetical protein